MNWSQNVKLFQFKKRIEWDYYQIPYVNGTSYSKKLYFCASIKIIGLRYAMERQVQKHQVRVENCSNLNYQYPVKPILIQNVMYSCRTGCFMTHSIH